MENFEGIMMFDQNVVSHLELLRVPYTGCNPRGLMLARDKALSKTRSPTTACRCPSSRSSASAAPCSGPSASSSRSS